MPTLNWIGKEAVVKHHKDVPFRLLEPVAELSLPSLSGSGAGGEGDRGGNLIVQGNNLHALNVLNGPVFALLPRFAGPKVVYAAANRMSGRAARLGLTFKQTP